MADKLHFSLVSPERELYAGEVDQVDIPGTEGNFGVLPDHAPLMAAIRTGAITVYENGAEKQFFVQGGFADVTPAGLTVLAERAAPMSELTSERIQEDIASAKDSLVGLEGEAALAVQQNLDGLNAVAATL
ncbi:ATP synthase F1 subunit epsilon [Litorimonas sp.]|jgi:F-type H+-transporting ATPase subunit epsilon|uniref:ATP synthase F1 subunit epsilon n=1 Tax=Litorimonas sp. TaxID=1892381 RepID=UPI003A88D8B7